MLPDSFISDKTNQYRLEHLQSNGVGPIFLLRNLDFVLYDLDPDFQAQHI